MSLDRRLSVAPMMEWTDRHCRYFLRLIARRALLYTEMVPTGAILRGDAERFLAFNPAERPLALQLGGGEPGALATCAEVAESFGYDEVNLNVGCPSGRVRKGRFGACLMAEPELVADCVEAMRQSTSLPVTVKTRIGIDDRDDERFLHRFVASVAAAGCRIVVVHARKAWLNGLSPSENRVIPPLRYDAVHRLKRVFPDVHVVVNGGIRSAEQALEQLRHVDGVMIGREAYEHPYSLVAFERVVVGAGPAPSRHDVVADLLPYIERERARGVPLKAITRHILGLFNGIAGARAWRRVLSEEARRPGAGPEVVRAALRCIGEAQPPRLRTAVAQVAV